GVVIDPARSAVPAVDPSVIEGAGGASVPVTRGTTYADVFAWWNSPTVIVARTESGTINHSSMTIEVSRGRGVPVSGVAFVGDGNEDSEATIAAMGQVRRSGRSPRSAESTAQTVAAAFATHFRIEDFR
ncbi:hypothetical protein OY671_012694, partial [Metschnikowia pulcherrima]